MAIRMFQYDTAIAVEHATQTAEKQTEVHFPRSCVLYIRNHSEKDEQHTVNVHFADGQTIDYNCPILYAQNYTVDSIFEKRLLLLLPYHILRYEHFLKSNKVNEKKIQKLLNDYALIRERLNQIIEKNEQGTFYFDLIKLINQVADYIIPSDNPVKERLGNVMGGKVLTLWSEELLEAGETQGKLEQTIHIILDFLSDFGTLPDSLCEIVKAQTNLDILNSWVRKARYAESIEDFIQKIEAQQ